jgi:hypothetical protein
MSATPVTRKTLRRMNLNFVEQERVLFVENFVNCIYNNALKHAKNTTETFYRCELNEDIQTIIQNKGEILSRLRHLFPDCAVNYKSFLCRHADQKLYDIDSIDKMYHAYFDRDQLHDYIVIDWS